MENGGKTLNPEKETLLWRRAPFPLGSLGP